MKFPSGRQGLFAVAAAAGLVLILFAVLWQRPSAPEPGADQGSLELSPSSTAPEPGPDPSSSAASPAPEGEAAAPDAEVSAELPLPPSTPVSISIPSIDVTSSVIQLGTQPDGTLAVPQPGPDLDKAAWFEGSPTPGQPGPSIMEGHVSTAENGPSVFYDLAKLSLGDKIRVEREDGRTVEFSVYATREFAKDSFPTRLVYGGDLSTPTLRLITCSNLEDGHHTSNLVVFAKLTDVTD